MSIAVLVPPRSADGLALIAESNGHGQPVNIYLAVKHAGGIVRWEPQPMPPAWRAALIAMGMNVPEIAP